MKTILLFFALSLCTSAIAQNLDYVQGYKFDVDGGFYLPNPEFGDILMINHNDSIEGFDLMFQPTSHYQSTFFIEDNNDLSEVAALISDCDFKIQSAGTVEDDFSIILGETECDYQFLRSDGDTTNLSHPGTEFTGIYIFLDSPDRELNAGLYSVNNSIQKATNADSYILLTGHTHDTLGISDIDGQYSAFDLQYENSGYVIAMNDEGKVEWYFENESEPAFSFIRGVSYINDKIYVAHDQLWKTDLLVLSTEGELLEEYTLEGLSVYNITSDDQGNIFLSGNYDSNTGSTNASLKAGEIILPESDVIDAFILKYDEDLNHLWTQIITGDNIDTGVHCTVDDEGDVFLTGCIQKDGVFDKGGANETTYNANGFEDVFLAKYSSNGELIYANTMGGSSSDIGLKVSTDSAQVKLWGLFRNTIDLNFDDNSSVLFTDENPNEDESYFYVIYDDMTLSVNAKDEILDSDISIYPNPVHDFFYIMTNQSFAKDATLVITDMTGRNIAIFENVPRKVDTKNIKSGMYLITIHENEKAIYTKKIVIY